MTAKDLKSGHFYKVQSPSKLNEYAVIFILDVAFGMIRFYMPCCSPMYQDELSFEDFDKAFIIVCKLIVKVTKWS